MGPRDKREDDTWIGCAKAGFVAVRDDAAPWDPILDFRDYNQRLKGDIFGQMFYERRGQTKLRRS